MNTETINETAPDQEPVQQTASQPDESQPPEDQTPQEKPAEKKRGSGILVLLLALIALALAAYAVWLVRESAKGESGRSVRIEQLAEELDALPMQIDSRLHTELARFEEAAEAQAQMVKSIRGKVDRVAREMSAQTTADRSDWMMAEVEYLLRLASQRVSMEGDLYSANVILKAADSILMELNEPRLRPVRGALAEDLAALQAAGTLDIDGIFMRLAATGKQIDALPLLIPSSKLGSAETEETTKGVAEPAQSASEMASSIASAAWAQIRELVIIRHRDNPVRPLLPPREEYYLRQNLRMLLEQAQLGLMRGSNAVYQESLAAAGEWLTQYFPTEDAGVQAMQQALRDAAGFDVTPRRPDVTRALLVLQKLQSSRHWRSPSRPAEAAS